MDISELVAQHATSNMDVRERRIYKKVWRKRSRQTAAREVVEALRADVQLACKFSRPHTISWAQHHRGWYYETSPGRVWQILRCTIATVMV